MCVTAQKVRQVTQNNVKLKKEKDKMMKTKTLITTVALTGALLASASVAKANAYMELISGTSSVIIPAANLGPNGITWAGTVGSWDLDIATGTSSGSLVVGLNDLSQNAGLQTAGLEVIYSSGQYGQDGKWTFGASDPGGESLTAQAQAWESPTLYIAGGSLGTQLGSTLALAMAPTAKQDSGTISGSYYLNEVLIVGDPSQNSIHPGHNEFANLDATFRVTTPDGGMTLSMVGSVLLGLAGLRSKFGAKRG
jgi:hypothetical protein